jgi:hypothetical protein
MTLEQALFSAVGGLCGVIAYLFVRLELTRDKLHDREIAHAKKLGRIVRALRTERGEPPATPTPVDALLRNPKKARLVELHRAEAEIDEEIERILRDYVREP